VSLDTPTATFPEIVNGLFVAIDRIKVYTKSEVRIALPDPEIIGAP